MQITSRTRAALWIVIAVLFVGVLTLVARVNDPPVPEPLTEVQKLKLQVKIQKVELAQRQVIEAQAALQRATSEAQAFFAELKRPGYDLNIDLDKQIFEYVKTKDDTSASDKK